MNGKAMKMTGWAAILAAAGVLGVGMAEAANPAYLNIDVAITANLSVAVNGVASSTDATTNWNTATPNQAFAAVSSATVTNDSGGQTEKLALSTNANSIDTGGGSPGTWALAGSSSTVGADQFAVQAVFGSSNTAAGGCPAAASGDWNQAFAPVLTAGPVTYTSAVFSDTSLNNNGTSDPDVNTGGGNGRMVAGSRRALCWRIVTPSSTSTTDTQNVQVIVTAQNP